MHLFTFPWHRMVGKRARKMRYGIPSSAPEKNSPEIAKMKSSKISFICLLFCTIYGLRYLECVSSDGYNRYFK